MIVGDFILPTYPYIFMLAPLDRDPTEPLVGKKGLSHF